MRRKKICAMSICQVFSSLNFSFQTEVEPDPNVTVHFNQVSPLTLLLKSIWKYFIAIHHAKTVITGKGK